MELTDFFAHVMPEEGFRVLGLAKPHPDDPRRTKWRYRKYDTNYKAAGAARIYDDRAEEAVYFGVNSFNDYYYDEDKGYDRIRTQVNVCACRSLFDDFDVSVDKDDAYDTRDDAILDLKKLAKALQLKPTIVTSGGGFHMYITADADFDPDTWIRLSLMKRAVCEHLGIKVDTAVDKDIARVLRPITTHNRKKEQAREVKLISLGTQYPLATIEEKLQKYLDDNDLQPAKVSTKGQKANLFAAALGDYPPSDPDTVADKCAVIGKFRETGGESEPEWHKCVGVIKHCKDGETKIHEWSSKYEGYNQTETQEKIDAWTVGPTRCEEMDKLVSCMESCPFAGKCASPIQLGATEDAQSVEEAPQVSAQPQQPAQIIAGQNIPYWQAGFQWNGSVLSRAYTVEEDGNTIVMWRPFCRTFIYPINRIKDVEGRWIVKWRALEKNGDWREFDMPMEELASTDQMARTLSAHEVFLTSHKTARKDMSEFAIGLIEKLQEWRTETKTYNQFGWVDDYSGFVMGTKMITPDDETTILCDEGMPPDIVVDFGRQGSLDEWIDNIDVLYNRAGAEPFQFALCHSMGSVLIELMGSSNWHGLPLAFTGKGGTGKSTACKIACGFYGKPKLMERQTGDNGSTLQAAIKLTALMGSIPILLDEFSGRSPDELTRTGYALANGRDKQRLNGKGGFATVGAEFFKNSFITSNDSIVESISKLPAGYRVEATQLRYFEVPLPEGYRHNVFHDVDQGFAEHHMDYVYGEACVPYLRFIMKNVDWVKRQLQTARAKYNPQSDDENKERFYRDAIVTATVAGKIAKKLGLVTFDVNGMRDWAQNHVLQMRDSRRDNNVDISEQLAKFISTLPGRLIVTKRFGDGRSKKEDSHEPLRAAAVGRVATDDRKVFLSVGCINDWCKDNGVATSDLKEEMDRAGYIKQKPKLMYIGQGSTVPSGQARCFEINYNKLFSGKALSIVEDDDGIHTEASGTA